MRMSVVSLSDRAQAYGLQRPLPRCHTGRRTHIHLHLHLHVHDFSFIFILISVFVFTCMRIIPCLHICLCFCMSVFKYSAYLAPHVSNTQRHPRCKCRAFAFPPWRPQPDQRSGRTAQVPRVKLEIEIRMPSRTDTASLVSCNAHPQSKGYAGASAKIKMRIMPTKSRGCWALARTPASPTMPMASPRRSHSLTLKTR